MAIGRQRQATLDRFREEALSAWNWSLGSDVNPRLLTVEAIDSAYEEVRAAIRDRLDRIAAKAGQPGYSENFLRGTFFPAVWSTLEATGQFLEGSPGNWRPATAKDLRGRLLLSDQAAKAAYQSWKEADEVQRKKKRDAKQDEQIIWNEEIYRDLVSLARDLIEGRQSARNTKEACANLVTALTFFTGRRTWVEISLRANFDPVVEIDDSLRWADDWVVFSGRGKLTQAEELEGADRPFPLPLFDITSEELIDGLARLRHLQKDELWYRPDAKKGYEQAESALSNYTDALLDGPVRDIFAPVIEGGWPLKLMMKTFRQLYVSHGQAVQKEWCMRQGMAFANINGYARKYIGHFGKNNETATSEYLVWEYLGPYPVYARRG